MVFLVLSFDLIIWCSLYASCFLVLCPFLWYLLTYFLYIYQTNKEIKIKKKGNYSTCLCSILPISRWQVSGFSVQKQCPELRMFVYLREEKKEICKLGAPRIWFFYDTSYEASGWLSKFIACVFYWPAFSSKFICDLGLMVP